MTYKHNLLQDAGIDNVAEFKACMMGRTGWQERVNALM